MSELSFPSYDFIRHASSCGESLLVVLNKYLNSRIWWWLTSVLLPFRHTGGYLSSLYMFTVSVDLILSSSLTSWTYSHHVCNVKIVNHFRTHVDDLFCSELIWFLTWSRPCITGDTYCAHIINSINLKDPYFSFAIANQHSTITTFKIKKKE